jgi:hypothetical protein
MHAPDHHHHRAGVGSDGFGPPLMLDEQVSTDHVNDDHSLATAAS